MQPNQSAAPAGQPAGQPTDSLNASNHATSVLAQPMDVQAAVAQLLAQQSATPTTAPSTQSAQGIPQGFPAAQTQPYVQPENSQANLAASTANPQQLNPQQQSVQQFAQPLDYSVAGFEVSAGTQTAMQMLGAIGVDASNVLQLAQDALRNQGQLDLAQFQMAFGDKSAYALQAAQALIKDGNAYIQRAQQDAYAKVGGEAAWQQLTNQFKATAPHMQEAVQQLVNSNQLDAAIALMRSVVPAGTVQQPQAMQGALQQPASATPYGLSEQQFAAGLQALNKQYPNQSLERGVKGQLYAELVRQREAGMAQGL